MKINKRLTIVISILGGLSLLIFGAVAIPTIISIRNLRTTIAEDYLEIEHHYALRRHTRSSLDALKNLNPALEKFSSMVIIEGKELDFISSLERAASLSGVNQDLTLETVNQKEISAWERDVPIKIKVAGTYPAILAYLERIYALPYYIIIRNLDINTASSQKQVERTSTQVQVSLTGNIRWFAKDHPILSRINSIDDSIE